MLGNYNVHVAQLYINEANLIFQNRTSHDEIFFYHVSQAKIGMQQQAKILIFVMLLAPQHYMLDNLSLNKCTQEFMAGKHVINMINNHRS